MLPRLKNDRSIGLLGRLFRLALYRFCCYCTGFDHGVGHSLLLLYDAKTPRGQKIKEFKGLSHDPSNTFICLFYIINKYTICITV